MSELTKEQEKQLSERIKLARTNLVDFRYYMLLNGKDDVNPAPFHLEWSNILINEKDNFAIEGFRESGKGQIVLRAFPLYCLMFPSPDRDYIVLIKQDQDLAWDKLIEIENEYLTNPLLNQNLVQVKQKSGRVFSVDVKDVYDKVINVRIEAYGKGQSIRGLANVDRKPRIVVIDDPQDIEDAKSDTVLDNDWTWFLSDVVFLSQKCRIFLIGNNLGDKCIVERIMNSPEELNFRIRRVPVLNEEGESQWPEMFPKEAIEKEKENYRKMGQVDIWMRERMCQSSSAETRVFDRNDVVPYSYLYVDSIIKGCNIFMTFDPASSQDKSACFRAICINAVTEDNRWIILDMPYGRWPSDVAIDKLFENVIKWTQSLPQRHRMRVGIEKGHYQQVLQPFLYREMQRRNIFFDPVPLEHIKVGTKLERIKMLGPRFKSHSILFPETAPWLAEMEAEMLGVTIDGFKSTYVDLLDALAMQFQIAVPPVRGSYAKGQPEEIVKYDPFTMKSTRSINEVPIGSPI